MTDPIAMTVHPGGGLPPGWRRELIGEWLAVNGINPELVFPDAPISIFTVPSPRRADEEPWLIKVIAFTQLYATPDGRNEYNFLTHRPVTFERTAPLQVPFPPPAPGDEGTAHGQEPEVQPVQEDQLPPQHQGRSQEDEQQAVRLAQGQEVSRG